MDLFYCKTIILYSENVLDENESTHLIHALRKKAGDKINLTNGNGKLFEATILHPHPKKCTVFVEKTIEERAAEIPYTLHIAIAPTKNIDRFEYFVEKAVEIGVSIITPLWCETSERKTINKSRIEKICLSAMKQSESLFLPVINDPIRFIAFIEAYASNPKLLCVCAGNRISLGEGIIKNGSNIILIGPEGDFSKTEIEFALQNHSKLVSLGNKRMRVETAGIYVTSACHVMHQ